MDWLKLKIHGMLLNRAGRLTEAIEYLTQSLILGKHVEGMEREQSLTLNYLALVYVRARRGIEAEAAAREAIRFDGEHGLAPATGSDCNLMLLAKALHQQGRCKEAYRIGRQALRIRRRLHGWRHPHYRETKTIVASIKVAPTLETAAPVEKAA